jgi:diaminopimelate epimerase
MLRTGVLRLTKHHGAGNDFLVLLDSDRRGPFSSGEARALCDRRRGLGADGLLRAHRTYPGADLVMDLHNADGGRAETSGNGVRCLVQAAVDAGFVTAGPVSVMTDGGMRRVDYHTTSTPGLGWARVDMGPAIVGTPLSASLLARTLSEAKGCGPAGDANDLVVHGAWWASTGNPHLVLFTEPIDDSTVATVGNRLQHAVERAANVEFVWPADRPDELELRVYERGAGWTLACGTGSCAAAAIAHRQGLVGRRVRVHNPGGTLEVELLGHGVALSGPTRTVGTIEVDEEVLRSEVSTFFDTDGAGIADAQERNDEVTTGP